MGDIIAFVHADDWVAVYNANGDCISQGHSVREEDLLVELGFTVTCIAAQGYADEHGEFPQELSDLPEEAIEDIRTMGKAANDSAD